MAPIAQTVNTNNIAFSADIYRLTVAVERQVSHVVATLSTWNRRRNDRLMLASMSSHSLEDIGLSYADAQREATKPFWRA